ncbi:PIN domain-containing protein [uncultured Methanoregula sp.]|uniref:PIN domain-containing protein n=1 Tax=uncultured Methanoregula sp. TaxID=1005933 RepID=UPI002AAB1FBB|nr:PIN domain-containing protein [uncultured Methanoregula sp.]
MKIYMDVCCLCRPFDDLQNRKIRLEAVAILTILDRCSQDWELVGSAVIDDEISRLADIEKRLKVEQKLTLISEYIELNETIFSRVREYQKAGLKLFDALHITCAESGKTIFLTTDNKIITLAGKIPAITITVQNPVHWLMEVSADENNQ